MPPIIRTTLRITLVLKLVAPNPNPVQLTILSITLVLMAASSYSSLISLA